MKKYLLLITCLFAVLSLLAQRTVSGKVTDENGNPIANASVTVKETGGGVSTDASGNFSLRLDPKARTLVFSYIGKASEEIVIGNQSVFNARLKQEGGALDEVVVVAYGTQ
ncbi:MAG TPA: carboxypeptidase-like regulatory domain-containing protein, partial [Chitinophagaceae bacterium]|nr:carboxypeptidase-like regulatory domain-containing protein [Chitinophagaceae bacterium]